MLPALPNSGDSAPPHDSSSSAAAAVAASDLGSSGFSEDERGRNEDAAVGRNSGGGNRWPRQETLYLLKIRSDMDALFRDSSLKGPLWEEVSRKLASLGFHRSAKKCKEKFENVYKYHKRIKEGRGSKSDGKTYKFFEQLEALETTPATGVHQQPPLSSLPLPPPPSMSNAQIQSIPVVTPVSLTVTHQNNVDPISVAAPAVTMPPMNVNQVGRFPFSQLNLSASSGSSSDETSEDEPLERRRSRKRKWKEFFGKLMKEVIDKQEELQSKFLDTLERRERDRTAREEAWRMQEMAKMKREHELLVQERSMIAAKDAAVITFLQKIADQNPPVAGITQIPAMQLLQQQQQNRPPAPTPTPATVPPMQQQQQQQPQSQLPPPQPLPVVPVAAVAPAPIPVSEPVPVPAPALPPAVVKNADITGGGGEAMLQPSPSRWPKAEINALIQIRTSLDTKYQETGPKGPLWEEVSAMMRNLGYNRNAKRCKEKWENINKYYKKVKESSKRRPEDSKTCPYFHQLDAIYREKASSTNNSNSNLGLQVKPEAQMAPIMARPEQQWPLPSVLQEQQQRQYQHQQQQQQQQSKVNEPRGNDDQHNTDLNDDDYDDDEDEDDDEEDEEGGDYEVVQNKTSSMAAV
ncbi:hypothetical protein QVD17_01289 [Tagetes erecta]|uniref:Myb-like domain-containing protein n=1 Tax=Tagetes erecta TaxID=13708 RepID=A0AAD8L4P2_TARER|nr:hypothetical protein QVD17_01289 [Tagetes erecta]